MKTTGISRVAASMTAVVLALGATAGWRAAAAAEPRPRGASAKPSRPVFVKPILAADPNEQLGDAPGSHGKGGRNPGGHWPDGDAPGSFGVPKNPLADLDSLIEDAGKRPPRGDGIDGLHNRDGVPDSVRPGTIPELPLKTAPQMPAGQGDVDGGAYHGIHPKFGSGLVSDDTPPGGTTPPGGNTPPTGGAPPGSGQKPPASQDEGRFAKVSKIHDSATGNCEQMWAAILFALGMRIQGKQIDGKPVHMSVKEAGYSGGQPVYRVQVTSQTWEYHSAFGECVEVVKYSSGYKPGLEHDGKVHPRNEPQLIYEMSRASERAAAGKPRPDESLIDPRPAKNAAADDSAAQQNAPAAGKAEAKWKFVGIKPGSHVTDPAEPQGGGADKTPQLRPLKHFQVIDPPQAACAASAKGGQAHESKVLSVQGSAQRLLVTNGRASWVPVKPGDVAVSGSILRTGLGSRVELALPDGTKTSIGSATKVGLAPAGPHGQTGAMRLDLAYGRLRFSRTGAASARPIRPIQIHTRAGAHQLTGQRATISHSPLSGIRLGGDRGALQRVQITPTPAEMVAVRQPVAGRKLSAATVKAASVARARSATPSSVVRAAVARSAAPARLGPASARPAARRPAAALARPVAPSRATLRGAQPRLSPQPSLRGAPSLTRTSRATAR